MSKGYILVDVPEKCSQCSFWFAKATEPVEYRCMAKQRQLENLNGRPDWCPIRELPEEMEVCGKYPQPGKPVPSYRIGWNDCLKTIISNQEERDNAKEI